MKKIFTSVMAIAAMFAISCQSGVTELDTPVDNYATVSFSVGTPEIATRDFSDGSTATVLQYAVYDASGNELKDLTVTDGVINGSATVSLQLTTGNDYSVIFWAAAPNAPYTVDFAQKSMTVSYQNALSNDETRDAFYAYHQFSVTGGAQSETIYLKRPFAQLNIGTNDLEESKKAGYTPTHSAVTVKNVYTTLNLVDGKVSNETQAVFASAPIPQGETFPVKDYEYLAMNYVLVPAADKEIVDVEFTYTNGTDPKTRTVGSVPLQRNYRTNIYGQVLTGDVNCNVEIVPPYEDPAYDNEHLYYIADGTYYITSAAGLAYFAEQVNAGNEEWTKANVVLTKDIDLSATRTLVEWVPIGNKSKFFAGTFDGAGYTVKNFQVTAQEGHAGLFGNARATIKNLTVENVVITANHYAGGILGQGYSRIDNCHVKNINITLTTKDGDWGDKAGGIVGQNCEGTLYVKNSTAEDVTIKGYRDLGGIAGMAHNNNTVSDCSVKNITIIQDLSVNYEEKTPVTLGGVVGRQGTNVTYTNNTEENVTIATEVKSDETLNDALNASDDVAISLGDGEYNLDSYVGNSKDGTVTIVGNGIDNTSVKGATNPYNNTNSPGNYAYYKHLVFKDLTFETVNNGYQGGFGHAASVTFINCKIIGQFYAHSGAPHKFVDCTIDPLNGYLYTYASNCDFEGCTFESSQGKALQIYAEAAGTFTVNITDCTFKAAKVAYTDSGTLEGGGKPVTAIDINSNGEQYKFVVNVKNSTATGYGVGVYSNSDLWNIKGGSENVTLTIDGQKKCVSGFGIISEGYYAVGNTYTVLTGEGFKKVATTVLADSSKDVTVELANDIDLAGIEWGAVKTAAAFVLDGKGNSIKNLTTSAVEDYGFYSTAMFTSTRKATTIKNVVVENAAITGNGQANSHGAVLVACNYSDLTISGVTVKNSTVSNCDRSSIITTYLYFTSATVENCVVEGCTVNSIGTAGALLGVNNSNNFVATNNTVKSTTITSSEGENKAGILIGTWQDAGTLTNENNVVESSKAINAGTETNSNIGRTA